MVDEAAQGIAARCRSEGGLTEATLGELREELGYKKLGRWVLNEIAESLEQSELGYFPPERLDAERNAEPRQWQIVWIYSRDGGARARIIDAILNPDKRDVRAVLDGLVDSDLSALNAEQRLDRIRDIVNA